ncbi:hypothetical protein ACFPVX_07065 [Cohnella faecalis]|uniref:Uncharacterized protein n=1 Tax=Cohnella faecalis TaxID=2315694 RepID=A0A398CDD9_9BACL|nr:hypothetical protein [Cohnella faecalis]RIE00713.1 hypothetical protein D3H35_26310 [Cohnella faecalis]
MQNDFSSIASDYERVVSKFDKLTIQARSCEAIIDMVIQELVVRGHEYDFFMMEDLLNALQRVQEDVLVELSQAAFSTDGSFISTGL